MERIIIEPGKSIRRDGQSYRVVEATEVPVECDGEVETQKTYYRKLTCAGCGYGPLRGTTKVLQKQGVPPCPKCNPQTVRQTCKCGHVVVTDEGRRVACGDCKTYFEPSGAVQFLKADDVKGGTN